MIYVFASLILHKAGKEVNEENIKKVLEAAGITPDEARVKALVAALADVDIEKVIKEAAVPVAAPALTVVAAPEAKKKEEKKKEEKKAPEEAAAGLGSLFGA